MTILLLLITAVPAYITIAQHLAQSLCRYERNNHR